MRPEDEEARLHAAMAEAHRQDAAQTPCFERMWSSPHPSRPHRPAWRWAVLSTAVVAAAAAVWLVSRPRPAPSPPVWLGIETRWVAPTDFLLQTPDLMTLRSLPTLDPAADPWARPPASRGLP